MTHTIPEDRRAETEPAGHQRPTGNDSPPLDQPSVTLVEAIRAHKLLVFLTGLGFAVIVAAYTWFTTPGATAVGQLGLVNPAAGNVLLPQPTGDATMARYTAQRALFAKSDAVLAEVDAAFPEQSIQELRGRISVTPSRTANAILISASGDSPDQAVELVEAVMASYRVITAADVEERSNASAEGWEARGDEARGAQVRLEGEAFGDGVEFEVSPTANDVQARSIITREVALGLVVGLGLGSLAAWAQEDGRRRRRWAEVRP